MNLYLAAIHANNVNPNSQVMLRTGTQGLTLRAGFRHLLESYHYINNPTKIAGIRAMGERVFLDSGAFSAHSLGVDINIEHYCAYVKTNMDIIAVDEGTGALLASVLDGIGSAKLTLENQRIMESNGVKPLPCFHFGEDERYLIGYLDNYEYITLGGLVPISTKESIRWLDRMWSKYIAKEDGTARVKVHAFGVTSIPIMSRYPWASVDSSTWVQLASNGSIMLPSTFKALDVSNKSPARKVAGRHLDSLPPMVRDAVIRDVETTCGLPIAALQADYAFRFVYNAAMYAHLQDYITSNCQRYKNAVQELF